jgi:hypothetical protein
MEAEGSSETLVTTYNTTECNNSDGHILNPEEACPPEMKRRFILL